MIRLTTSCDTATNCFPRGHYWQTFPAPVGCSEALEQPLTDLAPLARNDIWAVGAGTGPYPCEGRGDPLSLGPWAATEKAKERSLAWASVRE